MRNILFIFLQNTIIWCVLHFSSQKDTKIYRLKSTFILRINTIGYTPLGMMIILCQMIQLLFAFKRNLYFVLYLFHLNLFFHSSNQLLILETAECFVVVFKATITVYLLSSSWGSMTFCIIIIVTKLLYWY